MADALRISLRYANLETLQDGYGLNIAPLVRLALEHYRGDYAPTFQVKATQVIKKASDLNLYSRMQKAIAVILFKLEGQLILRHPELSMEDRLLLHRIDFDAGTVTLDGHVYQLIDKDFPTVDHPSLTP
jgi:fructose-1,6-bisphosphatase-3